MRWRRVRAGVYESDDGLHRIIRESARDEGPRGGTVTTWEHATPDTVGSHGWLLDGYLGWPTLRAAKAGVAERARRGYVSAYDRGDN